MGVATLGSPLYCIAQGEKGLLLVGVVAVGRQALFRFGHGQARRERGQKKEDDGESAENSHDAGQGKMLPV